MYNEYTKEQYKNLKVKFPGSENIEQNYSQALQDMFVLSVLNGKKSGTYVEIGGYDGIKMSNTYLLEKNFDWTGIAFEIDQEKCDNYNFQRVNKCFCEDATCADYRQIFIDQKLPKQIDYLQLDIDPAIQTLLALKALPLDEYRFSVITYETDIYNHDSSEKILLESREILKSHGYELLVGNVANLSNPFEDWYIDSNLDIDENVKKLLQYDEMNRIHNNTESRNILLYS